MRGSRVADRFVSFWGSGPLVIPAFVVRLWSSRTVGDGVELFSASCSQLDPIFEFPVRCGFYTRPVRTC